MDLTVNDLVQLALFMLLDDNESSAFDIECLQMYFHKCLLVIVFKDVYSQESLWEEINTDFCSFVMSEQ